MTLQPMTDYATRETQQGATTRGPRSRASPDPIFDAFPRTQSSKRTGEVLKLLEIRGGMHPSV